jgi:hypothetical protein
MFLGDCLVSRVQRNTLLSQDLALRLSIDLLLLLLWSFFGLGCCLKKFVIPLPVAHFLLCENVSALALAFNPVFHSGTNYMEVDYHFVCEKVPNRDIIVKFISTKDKVADVFTKGLSAARFLF